MPKAKALDVNIPDMSIRAKSPPINPPFNLSKFDLIKRIDKKTIVAYRRDFQKSQWINRV